MAVLYASGELISAKGRKKVTARERDAFLSHAVEVLRSTEVQSHRCIDDAVSDGGLFDLTVRLKGEVHRKGCIAVSWDSLRRSGVPKPFLDLYQFLTGGWEWEPWKGKLVFVARPSDFPSTEPWPQDWPQVEFTPVHEGLWVAELPEMEPSLAERVIRFAGDHRSVTFGKKPYVLETVELWPHESFRDVLRSLKETGTLFRWRNPIVDAFESRSPRSRSQ